MEGNDETRGPASARPLDQPDEAAEREVSERAVEPHQPTYPPQVEDEALEREERSSPDERTTTERVNDALHRGRPKAETGYGFPTEA